MTEPRSPAGAQDDIEPAAGQVVPSVDGRSDKPRKCAWLFGKSLTGCRGYAIPGSRYCRLHDNLTGGES